jgi:hypothetical protein
MSNDLAKQAKDILPPEPTTDLSELDQEKVRVFKEEGMPGLYSIEEDTVGKIFELYLAGKPYTQISRVTKVSRVAIMFMSDKFNWFIARREYLHELESKIRERVLQSRVETQDAYLGLIHMYQKKIGKKVTAYLNTNNDEHADSIDHKEVQTMMKLVDGLDKMISEPGVGKPKAPPAVGLNVGEQGVTMTKNDDGSVSITPIQASVGDMLKKFADAKREEEKKGKQS